MRKKNKLMLLLLSITLAIASASALPGVLTGYFNDTEFVLEPINYFDWMIEDSNVSDYSVEFYYQDNLVHQNYFEIWSDDMNYFYFVSNVSDEFDKIVFKNSSEIIKIFEKSSNPPTIENIIIEDIGNSFNISWQGYDIDNNTIFYNLYIVNSSGNQSLLIANYENTNFLLDKSITQACEQCQLKITANDLFNKVETLYGNFSIPRHSPEIFISSVENNSIFLNGELVLLEAFGDDFEDGLILDIYDENDTLLSSSYNWTIDNAYKFNKRIIEIEFAEGNHIISVGVHDRENNTVYNEILIYVYNESPCSETDGGYDIVESGYAYYNQNVSGEPYGINFTDNCTNLHILNEYYCGYDYKIYFEEVNCNDANEICSNGKCIKSSDFSQIGEFGKVSLPEVPPQPTPTPNPWVTVELDKNYINPVVVAKPLSKNNPGPAHSRLRNVENNSFEVRVEEWDCFQGPPEQENETVSYIVVEAGTYMLNGNYIEVGKIVTNNNFVTVLFEKNFSITPVILTQSQTYNDDPIVTRIRNISIESFEVKVQEAEPEGQHPNETISYIAIEPGILSNTTKFEVNTINDVTHLWKSINFTETFSVVPSFLADMQTYNEADTAGLRYKDLNTTNVKIFVEEEECYDDETNHAAEVVGYFVLE